MIRKMLCCMAVLGLALSIGCGGASEAKKPEAKKPDAGAPKAPEGKK